MGVFGATVACALLGFADDYTQIVKRRSLGLRGRTKMVVLLLISVGLWWVATHKAHMSESVSLRPFHAHIDLGPAYILFIYLVFAGTTNAVNLTDGLDGLAAGCAAIALLAYMGITFVTDERPRPRACRRLPVRRLHRLPLVQQLPGERVHGRHRLAGDRRRDRRHWR